jgi:hypothetical protein
MPPLFISQKGFTEQSGDRFVFPHADAVAMTNNRAGANMIGIEVGHVKLRRDAARPQAIEMAN